MIILDFYTRTSVESHPRTVWFKTVFLDDYDNGFPINDINHEQMYSYRSPGVTGNAIVRFPIRFRPLHHRTREPPFLSLLSVYPKFFKIIIIFPPLYVVFFTRAPKVSSDISNKFAAVMLPSNSLRAYQVPDYSLCGLCYYLIVCKSVSREEA